MFQFHLESALLQDCGEALAHVRSVGGSLDEGEGREKEEDP